MSHDHRVIDHRARWPNPAGGVRRGSDGGRVDLLERRPPTAEARLRTPEPKPWFVARDALLERLRTARDSRVVLVTAPPGYGKTTLLTQLATDDDRPVAWVSLDAADDEPAALATSIWRAMAAAGAHGHRAVRERCRGGEVRRSSARFMEWVGRRPAPFALLLDDVHVLRTRAALALLCRIVEGLPPGGRVAMAGRAEPQLPLARWEVRRDLVRIGPRELAMDAREAAALLRSAGVPAEPDRVDRLVRRAEGWPAGLYLAARAASDGDGADRLVRDYLRAELLDRLPRRHASFLIRTSVLDRLSAGACDAVLDRSDSSAVLAELERAHAFLSPPDGEDRRRVHPLLRETLLEELRRDEPLAEPDLHRRACAWHAARGQPDGAIRHALAAGDVDLAASLLLDEVPAAYGSTRLAALRRRMSAFAEAQAASNAGLAAATAWGLLQQGDPAGAVLWARTAELALDDGPPARGADTARAAVAALRAVAAPDGVRRMAEDAAAGASLARRERARGWRAVCLFQEGVASRLLGRPDQAEAHLEDALRLAIEADAPGVSMAALAQLALIAADDGDWDAAASLVARARAASERAGEPGGAAAVQVHAAAALVLAHEGLADDARAAAQEASRLLPGLSRVPHWMAADVRIVLARAALALGDGVDARALLSEADRYLARTPDPGVLAAQRDDAGRAAETFRSTGTLGASPLSRAELRVLTFLPTHLSYREIAQRLHRSPCTIKTQALAAFRKLDVSSRSEAVARARVLRLLPRDDT